MNTEKHLADALRAIMEQRDYHAEHGSYRPGTMGEDQCFDDWAADIAETVLSEYDAQAAVPANVVFAWGERSALSGGLPLVTMTQQGPDRFTVRYGMEVRARLDYSSACTELGAAIMHALACDSLIDNRTKAEARRDGDA